MASQGVQDFMLAEPLIVERLKERVPSLASVESFGELGDRPEQQQRTPSALVGLENFTVDEVRGNGERARYQQTWNVILVVRNARAQRSPEIAREEAGPLVAEVLRTLQGVKLDDALTPLIPASSPFAPTYSAGGLFYAPLAFTTQVHSYQQE